MLEKTTFTSFNFDYIKKIKELDKNARIGWLTRNPGKKEIQELLNISGEEMAPQAEYITSNMMKELRSKGLGIRAWGFFNVSLMKKMYMLNVDGMTVNFPDRLFEYLNCKK